MKKQFIVIAASIPLILSACNTRVREIKQTETAPAEIAASTTQEITASNIAESIPDYLKPPVNKDYPDDNIYYKELKYLYGYNGIDYVKVIEKDGQFILVVNYKYQNVNKEPQSFNQTYTANVYVGGIEIKPYYGDIGEKIEVEPDAKTLQFRQATIKKGYVIPNYYDDLGKECRFVIKQGKDVFFEGWITLGEIKCIKRSE